ncbi:non-specific serine/threonine protein kinase [Ranunculus cassubicifolius]
MNIFIIIFLLSVFSLSSASFSLASKVSGDETDKLSLLAFKSQLTENPQNALKSWNDSLHVCQWEGITCGRRHQRVVTLDLHSKGLGGPISPHIANLSFLRKIEFYNNSFHGNIPQELGRLFRLESLSLGQNSLVGEIPGNISHCSNLRFLYLLGNNLTGKIPMELGSLTKLILINLRENNLSGGIPSSLGNLTSLQTLDLSWNHLGGSIPSTFHLLRNLTELYLNECNLSGKFPPFLYNNLSAIEIISLYKNQLIENFRSDNQNNSSSLKIKSHRLLCSKKQTFGIHSHFSVQFFKTHRH